jgi:hypothetical protein
MSALDVMTAVEMAGVTLALNEDGKLVAEAADKIPPEIVAQLKRFRFDLKRILEHREAARVALAAAAPPDCSYERPVIGIRRWMAPDERSGEMREHAKLVHGAPVSRWEIAVTGLRRFISEGWGDRAALLGWTAAELYNVPQAAPRGAPVPRDLVIGPKPPNVTQRDWDDHVHDVIEQWVAQPFRSDNGPPPAWSRIHEIGAALLIGDRKTIAVRADNIVIEWRGGSQLKFRRIRREHIA